MSQTNILKNIKKHLDIVEINLLVAQKLVLGKIDNKNLDVFNHHPWADLGITEHIKRDISSIEFPLNSPVTIGDGPWPLSDFDRILKSLNIKCYNIQDSKGAFADCEMLVIGYETDRVEDIKELLANATDDVAIYPQELLIIYLLTGIDPLRQLSDKQIHAWIEFHPVLKELSKGDDDFIWPTIVGGGGGGGGTIIIGNPKSPLTTMGYIVGNYSNLFTTERHKILENIFSGKIEFPDDYSTAEKRAWGQPQTSTRLKKIAQHIVRNIRIRKSNKSYKKAVKEWTEDLSWLKKSLAPKTRRFKWPNI
jgi:hypothetical protein